MCAPRGEGYFLRRRSFRAEPKRMGMGPFVHSSRETMFQRFVVGEALRKWPARWIGEELRSFVVWSVSCVDGFQSVVYWTSRGTPSRGVVSICVLLSYCIFLLARLIGYIAYDHGLSFRDDVTNMNNSSVATAIECYW